nr:hypothetical protein [Tanacetum cinerariifolium]
GRRNNNNRKKTNVDESTSSFIKSDGIRNDANLKEVVLPYADEPVTMEVQSPLVDQTHAVISGGESYPPLPTQGTTLIGNTLGRSSYARVMIELRADVKSKDTIVVAMPKINRGGFYTCNVRVNYEWKPTQCACCKIFGHTQVECPKNPGLSSRAGETMNTGAGEKKTVKNPSQTSRVVTGNKKKSVEPTIEVSNSNPFDVLNSVDNDVEFGTNGV